MLASDSNVLRPRFVHRLLRARDYQPRRQLDAVRHWWRSNHTGVCALEGIGGAGKTAIAERFLHILPGAMPPDTTLAQDRSLPTPSAVFVFSFYDAPNPETFFWELAAWLLEDVALERARGGGPPYSRIYAQLARVDLVLILLDGLEKVQDDGARGGAFGALSDGHLKDLLFRAADGYLPNVGVLVTTRLTLPDLYEMDPLAPVKRPRRLAHYRTVSVAQLTPEGCTALLQRVGVEGTQAELLRIAADCGFHALTVDLLAGYIVRFLGGRASAIDLLPSMTVIGESSPAPREPAARYIHEQAIRFGRVATRYRDTLATADPAALVLLERICLFRLGATEALLRRVFYQAAAEDDSGRSKAAAALMRHRVRAAGNSLPASLAPQALGAKLGFLVDIHLLEITGTDHAGDAVYTTHPAIREGFVSGLDAEHARDAHDAARIGLLATLNLRPGESYPSESTALDQLEEVIYHTLGASFVGDAYRIYEDRLGGFRHLGWRLGEYARGVRISRSLLNEVNALPSPQAGLSAGERARLGHESALYFSGLGQVGLALQQLHHEGEAAVSSRTSAGRFDGGSWNAVAEIYLLAGRPRIALQHQAYLSDEVCAQAHALTGELESAMRHFNRALPSSKWNPGAPLSENRLVLRLPALQHCALLLRLGLDDEAERGARHVVRTVGDYADMYEAQANLLLAEVALRRGDFDAAAQLTEKAHEWAIDREARAVLCWSWLVRARTALGQGRAARETTDLVFAAMESIEAGLRIARECGLGIHFIDLMLEQAQAFLLRGGDDAAEHCVMTALYGLAPVDDGYAYDAVARDETMPAEGRGIFPPAASQLPVILAATHGDCDYAWGTAVGWRLLGEIFLLRAAKEVGAPAVPRERLPELPAGAANHITAASQYLDRALELQRQLMDAGRDLSRALKEGLAAGRLTPYPLHDVTLLDGTANEAPLTRQTNPVNVFISYAHGDNTSADPAKRWLDRLLQHITPLVRQRDLSIWSDQDLRMGDEWQEEIRRSLERASAAVLLVSPAYLASEYVHNNELPILLKRAKDRGLVILPIILRPCLFDETLFRYPDPVHGPDQLTLSALQTANPQARPLSAMNEAEQDEVLLSVAKRLLAASLESREL